MILYLSLNILLNTSVLSFLPKQIQIYIAIYQFQQ